MNTSPFFKSLTLAANGLIESKPVLEGLYLRFLEKENHFPISPALYAATKEVADIRIMEIKGTSDAAQVIELPEAETFCLAYQFMGKSPSWSISSYHRAGTRLPGGGLPADRPEKPAVYRGGVYH